METGNLLVKWFGDRLGGANLHLVKMILFSKESAKIIFEKPHLSPLHLP